ncbi:hypothetical protein OE88DRAFT_1252783 [Heliocybe sulcata]|uniref:Uncharacterized protein n=1 Tax=Heliocybe sulcata TaxID=5364 RepID=A0A5C3N8A0_9AGAM|nr:hypothetical protein OE88DRAFT_1252783 [Heliocybe sulcata]
MVVTRPRPSVNTAPSTSAIACRSAWHGQASILRLSSTQRHSQLRIESRKDLARRTATVANCRMAFTVVLTITPTSKSGVLSWLSKWTVRENRSKRGQLSVRGSQGTTEYGQMISSALVYWCCRSARCDHGAPGVTMECRYRWPPAGLCCTVVVSRSLRVAQTFPRKSLSQSVLAASAHDQCCPCMSWDQHSPVSVTDFSQLSSLLLHRPVNSTYVYRYMLVQSLGRSGRCYLATRLVDEKRNKSPTKFGRSADLCETPYPALSNPPYPTGIHSSTGLLCINEDVCRCVHGNSLSAKSAGRGCFARTGQEVELIPLLVPTGAGPTSAAATCADVALIRCRAASSYDEVALALALRQH